MPSVSTTKKLQAGSGLAFGVFLVLHLVSHYSLNLGYEKAQSALLSFRRFYQNPIVEIFMACSVLLHMYSNAVLYQARQKISSKKEGGKVPVTSELKGHRIAGYIIAASIFGHVFATRLGPVIFLDNPSEYDYSFVAKANQIFPYNFFVVYLAVFGMAAGWHLIYGSQSALATLRGSSIAGKPFPIGLKVVAMVTHVSIVSAAFALGGFYYSIDTNSKEEFHDKLFGAMGMH